MRIAAKQFKNLQLFIEKNKYSLFLNAAIKNSTNLASEIKNPVQILNKSHTQMYCFLDIDSDII